MARREQAALCQDRDALPVRASPLPGLLCARPRPVQDAAVAHRHLRRRHAELRRALPGDDPADARLERRRAEWRTNELELVWRWRLFGAPSLSAYRTLVCGDGMGSEWLPVLRGTGKRGRSTTPYTCRTQQACGLRSWPHCFVARQTRKTQIKYIIKKGAKELQARGKARVRRA